MIEKEKILDALLAALEEEANHAVQAARDAADYATNDQSKAESKWDTQGLEASYLAAGQVLQARQWVDALQAIRNQQDELLRERNTFAIGAVLECQLPGSREFFFVAPAGGGQEVRISEDAITVITPQCPLAQSLHGKQAGDSFQLLNGQIATLVSVR